MFATYKIPPPEDGRVVVGIGKVVVVVVVVEALVVVVVVVVVLDVVVGTAVAVVVVRAVVVVVRVEVVEFRLVDDELEVEVTELCVLEVVELVVGTGTGFTPVLHPIIANKYPINKQAVKIPRMPIFFRLFTMKL